MKIKDFVKSVISPKILHNIAAIVRVGKDSFSNSLYRNYKYNSDWVSNVSDISFCDRQCFIGYYDINPFNSKETSLLYHSIPNKIKVASQEAQICIHSLEDHTENVITTTKAWCYQQGARLRWLDDDYIIFNNHNGKHFVAQIWNVSDKKIAKELDAPIYDLSHDKTYGIGLNFVLLQQNRKGYGYLNLANDKSELDDYVYSIDIKSGIITKIVSISQLCEMVGVNRTPHTYINHISISPDDEKIMLFLINPVSAGGWSTDVFIINKCDGSVELLDRTRVVSHYAWYDNNHILATSYDYNHMFNYIIYNVSSKDISILPNDILKEDGHPTFFNRDVFITDTYPNKDSVQNLFFYNAMDNTKIDLLSIYHSRYPMGENRCDLHPRISKSKKFIVIDTCYTDKRSVLILKLADSCV